MSVSVVSVGDRKRGGRKLRPPYRLRDQGLNFLKIYLQRLEDDWGSIVFRIKYTYLFLFIPFLILLGQCFFGCRWTPNVYHHTAFQTGKVLESGQMAVGGQGAILYIVPTDFALSRGFPYGVELRGTIGITGIEVYGGGVELIKSVSKGNWLYTSASVDVDVFGNTGKSFLGYRGSVGYSLGFYRTPRFGFYLPLKLYWMMYNWNDIDEYTGLGDESCSDFIFVPGIGLSWEYEHFIFRFAVNVPFPFSGTVSPGDLLISDICECMEIAPFIGYQLLYRW